MTLTPASTLANLALTGAKAIAAKHNHPAPVAAFMETTPPGAQFGNKATIYRRGAPDVTASIRFKDESRVEVRVGDNKVTVPVSP